MTGETILVTRPKGDEKTISGLLQDRGYRVIHEPLTNIFLHHTRRQELNSALLAEPDAVIVTSRHGVQALATLSEIRDPCLICVGDATARAAGSQGYDRVMAAGGTAEKMLETITGSYDAGSRFLYVSGEHVRTDITEQLARHGMQVQRIVTYEALPSEQLSDTLVELLRREQIDAAAFMSRRAAALFTALAAQVGIGGCVKQLDGFCLSATIAEPLLAAPWKHIHITREPTLASLLECVDNAYHRKG